MRSGLRQHLKKYKYPVIIEVASVFAVPLLLLVVRGEAYMALAGILIAGVALIVQLCLEMLDRIELSVGSASEPARDTAISCRDETSYHSQARALRSETIVCYHPMQNLDPMDDLRRDGRTSVDSIFADLRSGRIAKYAMFVEIERGNRKQVEAVVSRVVNRLSHQSSLVEKGALPLWARVYDVNQEPVFPYHFQLGEGQRDGDNNLILGWFDGVAFRCGAYWPSGGCVWDMFHGFADTLPDLFGNESWVIRKPAGKHRSQMVNIEHITRLCDMCNLPVPKAVVEWSR